MSFVRMLFDLHDLIPTEATPKRLVRARYLLLVMLVALFPATFVEYQQAKFEPLIERVTRQVTEVVVPGEHDL